MPRERDLLEAIEEMEMKDAAGAIAKESDDEVARAIAADGGDAKAIASRGEAFVAELVARRKRLAWQVDAREKSAAARAKIEATPKPARLPRDETLRRIEAARSDATFAMALAARKGGTDEATDDELAGLLEELDMLRAQRETK